MKIIGLIVGRDRKGLIGNGLEIPWPKLKDDMKNFKELTLGYDLIMGRKTAESLGKPLSGRRNIVVSMQPKEDLADLTAKGFIVCSSFDEAMKEAQKSDSQKIWIIGGAQIYALALASIEFLIDEIHITEIDGSFEGDVYCPEINLDTYEKTGTQSYEQSERNPFPFVIDSYVRRA